MNLNIQINDERISELVSKGMEELDRETVGELAKKALSAVLSEPETAKSMVFETQRSLYGPDKILLRDWVVDVAKRSLTPDDLAKFKKQLMEVVERHAREIVIEAIAKSFVSQLFTYDAQGQITDSIVHRVKAQFNLKEA